MISGSGGKTLKWKPLFLTITRPTQVRVVRSLSLRAFRLMALPRKVKEFADALSSAQQRWYLRLPSHVVIGGKYSGLSDTFSIDTWKTSSTGCPIMPEISISAPGPRAICLGAVRLGIDHLNDALTTIAQSSKYSPAQGFNKSFYLASA